MDNYETYYSKQSILEKTLPLGKLKLTQRRLAELINSAQIVQEHKDSRPVVNVSGTNEQKGLYIVFEGMFAVKSRKGGVKLLELTCDYFGEEILWEEDY